MQFKIHYADDEIIVEGDTVQECRDSVKIELEKRGWNQNECWSEQVR